MNFNKGRILKSLCLFFIVGLFNLLLCSHNASALDFNDSGSLCITGGSITGSSGTAPIYSVTGCRAGAQSTGQAQHDVGLPTQFKLNFSGSIPAHAIFTISGKINAAGIYPPVVLNSNSTYYTLLSYSFGEYGSFVATYYSQDTLNDYLQFTPSLLGNIGLEWKFDFGSINYVTMKNSPTAEQISVIASYLNDTKNNLRDLTPTIDDIHDNTADILYYLRQSLSSVDNVSDNTERTAEALEEQQQQDEQDRSDLEQQTSDTDASADQLQSDVESATSTISSNISSIVGAFSTGPTDCIISVTSGPNGVFTMNNMNLCQVPDNMRQLIHNILSIIITISVFWISFNLLSQFLSIYENYLGAGGIKH